MFHLSRYSFTAIDLFLHCTEGQQAESARADSAEKAMKEQMEQRQKLEKAGAQNWAAASDRGVKGNALLKHRCHVCVCFQLDLHH